MGITIKDIAAEVGVSVTTVSRVLNNRPDVSDTTKEKVQKAIERLNYNPSQIARGLVLQKTKTIGLIIPDIRNPFFPEIAKAVTDNAKKQNYSVLFCNTNNSKKDEIDAINLMKSNKVDGIILSLSRSNKKEIESFYETIPIIQIDRKITDKIPAIRINNYMSAYTATEYLISLNHKKITHITGDLKTRTANERLDGFKNAVSDYNLKQSWVVEGDYSKESGYRSTKEILKKKNIPTAIFYANDLMALGAYKAVNESGFEIGRDISIIGHDDIDISSIVTPALTTIKQPEYKLGELAVKNLINKIEDPDFKSKDIILETELIKRDSTRGV